MGEIRAKLSLRPSKMFPLVFVILFLGSIYGTYLLNEDYEYPNIDVDTKTEFLSETYFTELSEQYDQIRSQHRKWYRLDRSKSIAAHAILLQMMNDLEENKARLVGHENHHLFFDTFDRYVRKLTYITEEIHYFRNVLNQYGEAPQRLEDMMELAACGKWRLFSARFHRYEEAESDAAYHVKFISESGRFEVVYHTESGEIVDNPINMGTYNYAPGSFLLWRYYQHHKYDKVPWKKWGNTDEISYREITKLNSRHGSPEQKNSTKKLEQLIQEKMSDSKSCS
ncbi:hypothetical protein ACFPM4_16030 [Lederbergia graminis]|uniref:Uncharacterized protein n=2 Tax=Lederbergia graminis TaxID=735518 RepID=A0ABW0LMI8_9BACI